MLEWLRNVFTDDGSQAFHGGGGDELAIGDERVSQGGIAFAFMSRGQRPDSFAHDALMTSGVTGLTAVMPDGNAAIFSIEGGPSRPVRGLETGELPVQWSEDGRALFVLKPEGLPAKLFRLDLETGQRSLWKEIAPSDPAGVFGVDPIRLTRDGKAYVYSYRRLLTDLYLVEGLK